MARRTKKTASRGSVNNIILESLLSGDKYGYEIIKEVEDKTDGKVKLKQPSLYSSLKRFESKNYIDSYWGDSDIGGRRHYYRITDAGKAYYKKANSNYFDQQFESAEDEVVETTPVQEEQIVEESPYELDSHEEEVSYNDKYTFSVEDKMRSLLGEEEKQEESHKEEVVGEPLEEKVEEPVVEETHEEPVENKEAELIDQMYEAIDEEKAITEEPQDYEQIEEVDENYVPDHIFYTPAPLADEVADVEEHVEEETHEEQEQPQEIQSKKSYEIVTDEFGITKLKSDIPEKKHEDRIVDNVSGRINYKDYVQEKPTPQQKPVNETKSLSSTNENVNYKDILGGLFNDEEPKEEPQQSSIFDNVQQEEQKTKQGNFNNTVSMEKYAQNAEDEGFTVKLYNKEKTSEPTYKNEYLLVNKLKFVFGLILSVLMIVQITAILICVSASGLLYNDQKWIYIAAYILSLCLGATYCIPFFISPKAQSSKSIKFNYAMIFGALAFFVSLILIYAINTFAGLDFTNTSHYISTILVPSILATNFIVGPMVYYLLTKNQHFY